MFQSYLKMFQSHLKMFQSHLTMFQSAPHLEVRAREELLESKYLSNFIILFNLIHLE